jgi:hypothetical protein
MLVEASVDFSERQSLFRSHLGWFIDDRVDRPRVQPDSGAFLGVEHVVQIREHGPQATHGSHFGFVGFAVGVAITFAGAGSSAAFVHRHLESFASGHHFDVGDLGTEMGAPARHTQPPGAFRHLEQDERLAPLVAARAVAGEVDLATVGAMGTVVHLRHDTSRLEEIEAEVFAEVDRMCLRVGALLHEARELDPAGFQFWVETRLPFGYDKARRLIAIHLAYRELPEAVVSNLPRPWQAMYALRRWADGRLEQAVEAGEVGPHTTQREALALAKKWSNDSKNDDFAIASRYGPADIAAGKLMGMSPDDIDADVWRALTRWMQRRSPDPA